MRKIVLTLLCLIFAAVTVGCTSTGAGNPSAVSAENTPSSSDIVDYTLYAYSDIGSRFFIRLYSDGTFKYYQNELGVPSVRGVWTTENEILTLIESTKTGSYYVNRFRVEKDLLVWLADGSDGFNEQKPHDGATLHAIQEETIILISAALEGFVTAESLKSGTPCQVELRRSSDDLYHDLELVITTSSGTIRQVVTAVERGEPCDDEKLYLADLDGDGVCEIILHEDCGGNGGYGSYRSRVFKVENNALNEIFEVAPYEDMDTGFYWEIAEPFAFLIRNRYTDLSLKLEADQYRKDYYFDGKGKLTADFSAYPLNVDNFYKFYPKDVDGDGIYELCTSQYTWDIAHVDGVGEAKCVIKYDSSSKSFRVVQTDFYPLGE